MRRWLCVAVWAVSAITCLVQRVAALPPGFNCVTSSGLLGECQTSSTCAEASRSPLCGSRNCCARVTFLQSGSASHGGGGGGSGGGGGGGGDGSGSGNSGSGSGGGLEQQLPQTGGRRTLRRPEFQCGGPQASRRRRRDATALPKQTFVFGGTPVAPKSAPAVGVVRSGPTPGYAARPPFHAVIGRLFSDNNFASLVSSAVPSPGRRPSSSLTTPFAYSYHSDYDPSYSTRPYRPHRRYESYRADRRLNYNYPRYNYPRYYNYLRYYNYPRYYKYPRYYSYPHYNYHSPRPSWYHGHHGDHRRSRRSPQSFSNDAEQAAFESVWEEYQQRVADGRARAGVTRDQLRKAYETAAAEVEPQSEEGAGSGWTCGAVLVSDHFMLTAAHCLRAGRPEVVRLGDLDLNSASDGGEPAEYAVVEVVQHPQYRPPAIYHDLALLRLEPRVRFGEHVRPFCVYQDNGEELVGQTSFVSGWGVTETEDAFVAPLQGGNLTIWSRARCDAVFATVPASERNLPDGVTSGVLCAGGEEQDACQGDSGGPLTVRTDAGTRLAGIVSSGLACATPGVPGLYINVAKYIDWIDSVVYGG